MQNLLHYLRDWDEGALSFCLSVALVLFGGPATSLAADIDRPGLVSSQPLLPWTQPACVHLMDDCCHDLQGG